MSPTPPQSDDVATLLARRMHPRATGQGPKRISPESATPQADGSSINQSDKIRVQYKARHTCSLRARPSSNQHASTSASQDEPTMVTDFPACTSFLNPSLVSLSLHPRSAMPVHAIGSTYPLGGGLGLEPSASKHRPNATSSSGRPDESTTSGTVPVFSPAQVLSDTKRIPRSESSAVALTPRANSTFAVFGYCDVEGGGVPSTSASITRTRAAGSRSSKARSAAFPATPKPTIT